MTGTTVAPELLAYLEEYLDEVEVNDAVRADEMDTESKLLVFCREFYAQLLPPLTGVQITGVNQLNGFKVLAVYKRRSSEWSESLKALIGGFASLCKMWPDILGEFYAGNRKIPALHFEFLPNLLKNLQAWANEEGQTELRDRACAADQAFGKFLAEYSAGEADE